MTQLQRIRRELADANIAHAAREIGMSRQQLWLIVAGVNSNPTVRTVERIMQYLDAREGQSHE